MVLRAGIIIPFQFRDTKKLLMIGGPEENRELSIWDLKNVVRAAFGIYHFEFRNKKIGFNIPDDLLLHYLAQRRDLTNFVIEINQANEDLSHSRETLSFEPSCSLTEQQPDVPLSQKSNESQDHASNAEPTSPTNSQQRASPMEHANQSSDQSSNAADAASKPRALQGYSDHTVESLSQSINPMMLIPKAEHAELAAARTQHYQTRQSISRSLMQTPTPAPTPAHTVQQHNQMSTQQFFPSYTHSLLGTSNSGSISLPSTPQTPHQTPYTPTSMMNRFRIFGAQQDNYNLHPHCSCSAQKLNDSPPPEPTNLCQQPMHTPTANTDIPIPPATLSEDDEQNCLQDIKLRIVYNATGKRSISDLAAIGENLPLNNNYDACSPKMDCDAQEEPVSPLSEQHHQGQQHQQQQQEPTQHQQSQISVQQQEMHERLRHEYMLQQQQQHQQLQQQQHMEAMLHEQQNNNNIGSTAVINNIRQRKERMSKRQKDLYVSFLQQYPLINEHRRNDPVLDPYWIKLADLLNAVPQGAIKHMTEWKQTFDNWRYRVFLYARYNSKLKGEEALNPRNFKPLTSTDKHAYAIWIRNPDTAPPDLDNMRNVFVNLEETQQE